MKQSFPRLLTKAFLISFTYVGIATITVLSVYPSSPLYGTWVLPTLLITFPANFISFGIMYSSSLAILPVLITQSIYLLVFWGIIFVVLRRRVNRTSKNNNF